MSDAQPVQVQPDELRTHASNVEGLNGPMGQAVEAAKAVSAPSDAFGKLCAFLPPLFVDSVETEGITALETAVTALTEDAAKLRAAADSFAQADDSNSAAVRAAGSGVSQ
ncbi:type VII secretion target [Nocardia cyriacigeorgica]|uniref:type VII secretion target n=1 Tax=Nocardia cyriacigeorgica TaxID=135487 RepID=UPI0013D36E16|nr:type VII secretion target [Nocardia cyriacigeorgica]MBF6435740.1 ESX-1 secretion-associated protein [Nocardia cyriacigeorgica]NEW30358.1 ESX-1 secretion-associated protein [Nocardia cyriacigeorgica]